MSFPATRMRRLRATPALRGLVRETTVEAGDLLLPLFVHTESERAPIDAMPGVDRLPVAEAVAEAREAHALGISGVVLFGIPATKDAEGSQAWAADGVIQEAISAIKAAVPNLLVIPDLCLCEYTDHGHCGILQSTADGVTTVDNDASLPLLARTAVAQAQAGADVIAPSDMMDGRVGAIRRALDDAGFADTPIMSYSSKFASAFYGPFREAADSTPSNGDRRGYQMDPANGDEAVRESLLDVDEGADILMVKPALPYLDVIWRIKEASQVPVCAYNVSGEYAMVKAAAAAGHIDERAVVLETLTAIRRAGADIVITYHAKDAASWLQ
ncbi:MAG: Porphobilinogen synthase [Solirubrobacterales bacterium]|nr:Porphobilinogen synthase [Solirubrobacterales bacterium]